MAKLPKLMNLITSSKEKMKKYSNLAFKENQSLLATSTAARYADPKSLLYDDRQKKSIIYNNLRSKNA